MIARVCSRNQQGMRWARKKCSKPQKVTQGTRCLIQGTIEAVLVHDKLSKSNWYRSLQLILLILTKNKITLTFLPTIMKWIYIHMIDEKQLKRRSWIKWWTSLWVAWSKRVKEMMSKFLPSSSCLRAMKSPSPTKLCTNPPASWAKARALASRRTKKLLWALCHNKRARPSSTGKRTQLSKQQILVLLQQREQTVPKARSVRAARVQCQRTYWADIWR